jgi:DNA gyrase subunit A
MGNILRTNLSKMRSQGRTAAGIIGMRLAADDRIIGMEMVQAKTELFVVAQKGYGKRLKFNLFSNKGRGGKGMTYLKIADKNGPAIDIRAVQESDDIVIVTHKGQSIRIEAKKISSLGRSTVGVRIMDLGDDDEISDIAVIPAHE